MTIMMMIVLSIYECLCLPARSLFWWFTLLWLDSVFYLFFIFIGQFTIWGWMVTVLCLDSLLLDSLLYCGWTVYYTVVGQFTGQFAILWLDSLLYHGWTVYCGWTVYYTVVGHFTLLCLDSLLLDSLQYCGWTVYYTVVEQLLYSG